MQISVVCKDIVDEAERKVLERIGRGAAVAVGDALIANVGRLYYPDRLRAVVEVEGPCEIASAGVWVQLWYDSCCAAAWWLGGERTELDPKELRYKVRMISLLDSYRHVLVLDGVLKDGGDPQ